MNRFNVPSSHLKSVGWEAINGIPVLEIEFKNGHIYRYPNVPELHFLALTHMASGVGTYFNQNIKNAFPCERIYKMSAPETITGGTMPEPSQFSPEEVLYLQILDLLKAFRLAKPTDRSELARRYAVTITELEKVLSYFHLQCVMQHGIPQTDQNAPVDSPVPSPLPTDQ